MSDCIVTREMLKRHCERTCNIFKDTPGNGMYGEHRLVLDLLEQTEWVPVRERSPKPGEYIGDVAKYYLVQDEYEDMLVARYCGGYWEEIHQLQPITDEIVAWRELPKSYKTENDVEDIYCDRNLCMCYECEGCPANKEKEE